MIKKDILEYKRKYNIFRHHAWAGLGFLSVVLAIRIVFSKQAIFLTPIVVILLIYIIVALIFTYRYRIGLSAKVEDTQVKPTDEMEKELINAEIEKKRLKLEKKKAKAEAKKEKKSKK